MDVEADLLIALRKIAGGATGDDFTLRDGDVAFEVHYVGGSSSRLTLGVPYDAVARADVAPGTREASYRASARGGVLTAIRPMSIVLRREDSSDHAAKAEGISREHQTGDARFDDDVYVDSPTTDDAVLRTVLNEAVRSAVMELIQLGFDSVTLDDGDRRVTAVISGFRHLGAPDEGASRIVHAFAKLLRGLPPVREGAGEHPHRSQAPGCALAAGGLALVFLGPIAFFGIADAHHCTESVGNGDDDGVTLKSGCGDTAVISLVAGIVVAVIAAAVARALARRRMSGHSDSHKRIFYVAAATFAWVTLVSVLTFIAIGYGRR